VSLLEPIFEALNGSGARYVVVDGSIPDLIELKRAAGRAQDVEDIDILEGILRRKNRDV
jgi:hypothetical protein